MAYSFAFTFKLLRRYWHIRKLENQCNKRNLKVTALHSVPRTEAKGFGNCISVLLVKRVWPALVFGHVKFSCENGCCNFQTTCSVIIRIAVIH